MSENQLLLFALLQIILTMLICGIIGALLGQTIKKVGVGFLLGCFLLPFGWIILFLLPKESEEIAKRQRLQIRRPERDVESESYQLWLVKKYGIEKNEVFDKYVLDFSLYESLEEAIDKADKVETEREELREERESRAREESNQILALVGSLVFLLLILAVVFIAYW